MSISKAFLARAGACSLALALFVAAPNDPSRAAAKNVDLNGDAIAESVVNLAVVSSSPVKIQNKVTNKAAGQAFTFRWLSAGPGGFSSSLALGTTLGVGTTWTWQTTQQVYSITGNDCTNDICFTRTTPADSVARGPFAVPGRSLTTSGVTVSNASLTSSLITFFSPPKILASVTSSVAPLGSGSLGYTTTYKNNTTSTLTFDIAAGPPGCCPDVHQLNCEGTCVYYLTDSENCGACGNVCASGEVCDAGVCAMDCPENLRPCNGSCIDVSNDGYNCGSCGHECAADEECANGLCVPCRPPTGTACNHRCVNIHTDSENCGACGVNCNFLCPSTGHGTCSQGQSCMCTTGGTPIFQDPEEAPICEFPSTTQTVPSGGVVKTCQSGVVLAKEVESQWTTCGPTIPGGPVTCAGGQAATQGPFNRLVPDLTKVPGNVLITLDHMEIQDTSGDRVPQPGEAFTLKLWLTNAGLVTLNGVSSLLSSPPIDVTQDGTPNPISIGISVATSTYPPIQGVPVTGPVDCSSLPPPPTPVVNATPFSLTIPSNYAPDVAPLLNLNVSGQLNGSGEPFQQTVPIVLGIGGRCSASQNDGGFDGLNGLLTPMAKLVKLGETPVFPTKALQQGKSFPMKLQILCGGTNLTGAQIVPPEIVGLTRNGVPIDISNLNLNADSANPNDPFFRFPSSGSVWNYNTRTKYLAKGTYVITIRIGGVEDYVTGFILN